MLSKNLARIFFLGGTAITFAVFLGLSWNTLSKQVPQKTHPENISQKVIEGKHLWESNNCMGCHTIMGEGAYYAPELTKVVERRGEGYIKAVLMSKEPWQPRGRKMVAYGFNDEQAAALFEFLKWIGNTDLNGFPAKPQYNITPNNK